MKDQVLRATLASCTFVAFTSASVSAQSFNIDAGAPATAPTSAYGAAAMQPGFWNDMPSGAIGQPIMDLFGAPTSVTVTAVSGGDFMFDNAGTMGDDELLLDDLLDGPNMLTVAGLSPGTYTVYTYSWAPDNAAYQTEVAVTNSPDMPQTCGGTWPGNHVMGVTFTMHTVTIDAANPNLEVLFTVIASFASLNGIQIVDPSGGGGGLGARYCSPAVTNSTGVPGEITVTGNPFASGNNVTLTASSLPMNSFGFFLTSQAQGLVQGPGGSQGDLCLGGAIGRYVGPGQIMNSGASGEFSLLLDLTQTPQPTGFVSVMAGETWNYQGWFRDAIGGMATSNFTDAVELAYQ